MECNLHYIKLAHYTRSQAAQILLFLELGQNDGAAVAFQNLGIDAVSRFGIGRIERRPDRAGGNGFSFEEKDRENRAAV